MLADELQRTLFSAPSAELIAQKLDEKGQASLALARFSRPFFIACNFLRKPRPTLVVVGGDQNAKRTLHSLSAYLGPERVLEFPLRTDIAFKADKTDLNQVGRRMCALGSLALGRDVVVVASARSLLRKMAPTDKFNLSCISISKQYGAVNAATGEMLDYETFIDTLVSLGYLREDASRYPGTFSVHGDTIDCFCAGMQTPARIEFFGDEVDGLRCVIPSTGQSIRELESVEIWPAHEFELNDETIALASKKLEGLASVNCEVSTHLDKLKHRIYFPGMSRYLPHLYSSLSCPIDYLSSNTLMVLDEPRAIFDDMSRYTDELFSLAKNKNIKKSFVEDLYVQPAKCSFGSFDRLTFQSMIRLSAKVDAELKTQRPDVAGSEDRLFSAIKSQLKSGNLTLMSVQDSRVLKDIRFSLSDEQIAFVERPHLSNQVLDKEVLNVTDIDIPSGLIIPSAKLALFSISDLISRRPQTKTYKKVDITQITFPFKLGDYVVHEAHGIALFDAIIKKEVAGIERDYLLLKYAEEDKLYVPVEQIGRITRYVGPSDKSPRLTRLHSADWSKTVTKAKKSAKKLAFDLVDLYSRRITAKGYSYSADSAFQDEMEQDFPYEETKDQLVAIEDVKADMESDRPMDRLICGDVGFGKTEVAMRAAFKAVLDSKQVMVLCPTTVLAQQHFTTFNDRFERFGVRVEVLSRFRTKAQQKAALKDFATGSVDMLVGTHRLLSSDVNPKNLGLVIIDEEQRFGVGHKEQLKNLRTSVDVLTLTATPIPRTLQMSLSGVRDLSLITTPPKQRIPVKVHVGKWDEDLVSMAIKREIDRGGQVYYVSNRVHTINDALKRILSVAPNARVSVAHGALASNALEDVMEQFCAGEIDVLVSTTIIENGLDNPHTNTLIIEDSQRLGLSQLYQLKGRVGRSLVQAYAYFLFPADQPLSQQAAQRLEAIDEFSDLGSGMKLAMRDLEIRGAGTLLGAQQSGNLSAVGFDLFASMIATAIADAKGEQVDAHEDVQINLPVSFVIDDEYIPAADERVLYYRKLASAQTPDDVEEIVAEMNANYGQLSSGAENVCNRAHLKALAAQHNISSISLSAGAIHFINKQGHLLWRTKVEHKLNPLHQAICFLNKAKS